MKTVYIYNKVKKMAKGFLPFYLYFRRAVISLTSSL